MTPLALRSPLLVCAVTVWLVVSMQASVAVTSIW